MEEGVGSPGLVGVELLMAGGRVAVAGGLVVVWCSDSEC